MKEEMIWSRDLKKDLGIKIGIAWKRYRNFGNTFILTELTRPIRVSGREDQRLKSSLVRSKVDMKFFLYMSVNFRVILTPRYLNSFLASLNTVADRGRASEAIFKEKSSLLLMLSLYPEMAPNCSRQ